MCQALSGWRIATEAYQRPSNCRALAWTSMPAQHKPPIVAAMQSLSIPYRPRILQTTCESRRRRSATLKAEPKRGRARHARRDGQSADLPRDLP
jgi:hypothetical protein